MRLQQLLGATLLGGGHCGGGGGGGAPGMMQPLLVGRAVLLMVCQVWGVAAAAGPTQPAFKGCCVGWCGVLQWRMQQQAGTCQCLSRPFVALPVCNNSKDGNRQWAASGPAMPCTLRTNVPEPDRLLCSVQPQPLAVAMLVHFLAVGLFAWHTGCQGTKGCLLACLQ